MLYPLSYEGLPASHRRDRRARSGPSVPPVVVAPDPPWRPAHGSRKENARSANISFRPHDGRQRVPITAAQESRSSTLLLPVDRSPATARAAAASSMSKVCVISGETSIPPARAATASVISSTNR